MFIPRTLADVDGGPGRAALGRAALVALLVGLALAAILNIDIAPGQVDLRVGQVVSQDISAPRSVSFVSESETEAAREAAALEVLPQYEEIAPRADIREDRLRAYDRDARRVTLVLDRRDAESLSPEETSAQLVDAVTLLTAEQRQLLGGMPVQRWEQLVAPAGRSVLDTALTGAVREDELDLVAEQIRGQVTADLEPVERELAGDLAVANLEPNLAVSEERTEAERRAAREAIPPVQEEVEAGEAIVREGDRITALDLEKLDALGLTRPRAAIGTIAGNALLAVLIAVLLVGFLWRFQPAIWYRNRSLLLFCLALVASAIAIKISADRTLWAFVVPTAATVLLIGILLGGSAGAAMAVALAVLAGVVNQDALEPAVYTLAGGFVSLLTIVRAERLNTFLRVGLMLALTNVAVVIAFSLLDQPDAAAIVQLSGAGIANAALAVLLAVGSFAVLGNVFGIMTVFQLLELANPSNRLLRRLLLETPGTYHHSVMVGNLAERAAETIGADPLLARVGAYYHDIGKMKNPLAFIENQAGAHNIHDDLSAETSARIIAGHIRDGIDLGYEHGLPVQIIAFIPQHHGTSTMSYFYDKAVREVGGSEELVSAKAFRYPGPKPQSREAAILMLSDGVEASVRSLDEKDEASIRAMVDRIVDGRVEDGQLDDAELTLKNIAQVKHAFVQQLLGMYHSRIKYPDNVVPLETRERA
ncbi:MAG: HD family phosphohydrolase [Candidatus Limnocylindria bacterium]